MNEDLIELPHCRALHVPRGSKIHVEARGVAEVRCHHTFLPAIILGPSGVAQLRGKANVRGYVFVEGGKRVWIFCG